jgi:hypothetical protein
MDDPPIQLKKTPILSLLVVLSFTVVASLFLSRRRYYTVSNLPDEEPIAVEELLQSVERFVSQDGPRLIQDGGRVGVVVFRATSKRLAGLVQKLAGFAVAICFALFLVLRMGNYRDSD